MDIQIGTVLPNGAIVLQHKTPKEYVIVLALYGKEFVTWKVNPDTGGAFWGHYTRDLQKALSDYKVRY